jgi:hypothetical protein
VDITRAFSYIFDDEAWAGKVVMVVVWTLVSAIPIIGLIGMAALAGYVVELITNMRRGAEHPLPTWDKMGDLIGHGTNVLIAGIIYNLGNLLIACGYFLVLPSLGFAAGPGSSNAASSAALAITCCLSLVILVYNLLIWPVLAVGTLRYARVRQINAFFQFGDLFATLNRHMGLAAQWVLFGFFASLVIGFFNLIPCLGWIASMALVIPVQGHLLGQFGLLLDEKPKGKPKRA